VVTDIDARWNRHPLTTCPGATAALRELIGCPLGDNVLAPQRFTDPLKQCTHMFDMMRLGIVHAWHRRPDCRYDAIIKDAPQGPQLGELFRDNEKLMELTIEDNVIQSPAHYRGVHIMRGFGGWAAANLQAEEREWAFFLQRAFFIANGRRDDYAIGTGLPAAWSRLPEGVCFASQPPRYLDAVRIGNTMDYSEHPQDVLNFFPLP
jgi:hypothetical protein